MKSRDTRMENMEKRLNVGKEPREPEFTDWIGHPWTPEEKADVMKKHPDCDSFYKALLPNLPAYEPYWKDRPVLRTLDGSQYLPGCGAKKRP